jgi:hypothetical protein
MPRSVTRAGRVILSSAVRDTLKFRRFIVTCASISGLIERCPAIMGRGARRWEMWSGVFAIKSRTVHGVYRLWIGDSTAATVGPSKGSNACIWWHPANSGPMASLTHMRPMWHLVNRLPNSAGTEDELLVITAESVDRP